MPIVEPLKRFRGQFRLTQNDVAAKLGIKQASYAQYEQKTKPSTPSADTIIKLARGCNVSADYLLGLSDEPRPLIAEKQATISEYESADDIQALKADNQFLKEQLAKLAEKVDKLAS